MTQNLPNNKTGEKRKIRSMNLDIWSTPTLRGRGTSEIQYGDRESDPTDVQGIIRG